MPSPQKRRTPGLWSPAISFCVVALAGYWICLSQLATFPRNQLPDTSKYPTLTVLPMLIMACIAAPVAEEAAFSGYCWTILERQFRPTSVVVFSSLLFALAHFTQGRVLANLLVYFLGRFVCRSCLRREVDLGQCPSPRSRRSCCLHASMAA